MASEGNEKLRALAPRIQHNYHDFSVVPDEALGTSAEATIGAVQMANAQPSFPVKLHHMLEQVEKEGNDDIVGWETHGRCFKIHDHNQFVEKILPRFFRQSKYASFQRQLNLYEFHRLTIGHDRGAYYHEMFLRGRPGLAFRMKRTKYKGKGPRKPASPQSEPNFYHMPSVSGNKEEDKQRNEQEALVSEDPMVTLNQHLDTIQQKLQPNLVAPPQPLLSPSLSLSSVSGPAPNMAPPPSKAPYFDDNVSALLDELIRRSAPAGPGPSRSTSSASSSMTPSCNNATNAGHLNLAAFLANQYRGDNHVHRQQQPPGNYCDTNLNMYQT